MGSLCAETVKSSLNKILEFLTPYLPLANAHASNFLTEDYWNTLLPKSVQDELLRLSEDELKTLPCGLVSRTGLSNTKTSACSETYDYLAENNVEKSSGDDNCEEANKTYNCTWIHSNINSFSKDALECTLDGFDLAISEEALRERLETSKTRNLFIGNFMNLKKGHEVEMMSRVCAMLAKETECKLVIDLGSGKGYLGNNLCLQYDISVLGVDAVTTNTQSAEKRMNLLSKQWNGLNFNARSTAESKKLTKKEKRLLKANPVKITKPEDGVQTSVEFCKSALAFCQGQKEMKTEDVTISNGNGVCCHEGKTAVAKYVPVTMYVEHNTNFMKVAVDNFPDIFVHTTEQKDKFNDLAGRQEERTLSLLVAKGLQMVESESDILRLNDSDMSSHKCEPRNAEKKFGKDDLEKKDNIVLSNFGSNEKRISIDSASEKSLEIADLDDFSHVNDRNKCKYNLMLTGLHTCGNLASTTLELFVNNSDLETVCSVGCCYHLLDEEFVLQAEDGRTEDWSTHHGFPISHFVREQKVCLGLSARNLAQQSVHRMSSRDERLQGERFFPRALLEVMVKDVCGKDGVLWTGLRKLEQKCNSTEDYIRKACGKLNISHMVSDQMIVEYIKRYKDHQQKLAAFFQLRAMLAPCIESLILLDRVCYLLEQENIGRVYLVRLFDPVISPRCHAIVAFKHKCLSMSS